jgi:hypothetical protein
VNPSSSFYKKGGTKKSKPKWVALIFRSKVIYRKPPTISPGLIFFRQRFLMGLYKGGGAYIWGGGAYTWTIFCVSNKQVSHKQENKH